MTTKWQPNFTFDMRQPGRGKHGRVYFKTGRKFGEVIRTGGGKPTEETMLKASERAKSLFKIEMPALVTMIDACPAISIQLSDLTPKELEATLTLAAARVSSAPLRVFFLACAEEAGRLPDDEDDEEVE